MDATLKRIADAYAAAQDALPAMMNSGPRDHWLGLVREFAASVLEALDGETVDAAAGDKLQALADAIRNWR